jgi:enoyl-CoA hydratase/carnithine racemase
MKNHARLLAAFGESRAKRMLLLGELLTAEEAQQAGFLARLVAPEALEAALAEVVQTILGNAPLTLQVSKEAIRRIRDAEAPDGDDLIRRIYGSADFKEGVRAFFDKRKADWRGE